MDIKQVGTKDTHTHALNIATQIRLGNIKPPLLKTISLSLEL